VHRIFFAPHLTNELLTGYQSLLYANLHGLFFAQAGGPERARQHQLQGPDGTTIFHLHSAESIYGDAPDASEAHRRCQSFLQALAGFARAGGRFVWTIHEDEPADLRYFHLHGELCRALASQADLVHCQSLAAAAATGTTLGLDPRSLVTLPAGNFQPLLRRAAARRDALRDQLGLDEDQRLLLHFGRRAAYKGTDRLLDVWPEAKAQGWKLGLAGGLAEGITAPAEDGVITLAEAGSLEDYAAWIAAADLVALPYRHAVASHALNLATSVGRPVLLPAIPALMERVHPGREAFVFAPEGGAAALAGCLNEALATPGPRLEAMGAEAARVAALYPWRMLGRQFADSLLRLVAGELTALRPTAGRALAPDAGAAEMQPGKAGARKAG
jgi:glycosyltransferase involved in cell wall biosynthesis